MIESFQRRLLIVDRRLTLVLSSVYCSQDIGVEEMPVATIDPTCSLYHAVPGRYLEIPLRELKEAMVVAGYDMGPNWKMTRRFATEKGGKYFSTTPEAAIAECSTGRTGQPATAIPHEFREAYVHGGLAKFAVYRAAIKNTVELLSVNEAISDPSCGVEFQSIYNVDPADTCRSRRDPAYQDSLKLSHRVAEQALLASANHAHPTYIGIMYESCEVPGVRNIVLLNPSDIVDWDNSDTAATLYQEL
jgi:hypothetical protein